MGEYEKAAKKYEIKHMQRAGIDTQIGAGSFGWSLPMWSNTNSR